MSKHFIHSGDLGDIIYSLPTIKRMGGGTLWLADAKGVETAHGMTRERFNAIAPLLEAQPYITAVHHTLPPLLDLPLHEVVNLNQFRFAGHNFCNTNLVDCHARTFIRHCPDALKFEKWLDVQPRIVSAVVIARSPRYHADRFPWRMVVEKYGRHAVFVGTPAEHAAFVQAFGDVPYCRTPNLLELARVIEGAYLFCGNQSCPLAIAEGLKQSIVLEECPACPNCTVPREGVWASQTNEVCLPPLCPRNDPAPDAQSIAGAGVSYAGA